MHRIDTPTAQKDKFGAGKNGFTRGNPQTGTPATNLDDDYFDMLQEELVSVVEAAGVQLDKAKHDQLLTALRSLLLSRAHPFADIKADGAAAVAEALSNLGIKGAALKEIGEGANQVPDMNFFGGQSGDSGFIRIPGGKLIVYGTAVMTSSSSVVTLPHAFKDTFYRVTAADRGNGCLSLGANTTSAGTITVYRPGKAYNAAGNLVDVTGSSAFSYFAVGDAP